MHLLFYVIASPESCPNPNLVVSLDDCFFTYIYPNHFTFSLVLFTKAVYYGIGITVCFMVLLNSVLRKLFSFLQTGMEIYFYSSIHSHNGDK